MPILRFGIRGACLFGFGRLPILEFPSQKYDKDYFDGIDSLRWSENELWAYKKFYNLPGDTKTTLLDAGCGIGVFTRLYAKRGFKVTAVDLTERAVELTRLSLRLNNLTAEVKQASVEDLPFEDNSFDYIVSNGVIHHTPQTQKAADEFYRVLKPGGKASVCIYYRNILLSYPFWPIVSKVIIPLLLKKSPGRENMFTVRTPEDFVKVYDGNDTPIAKVYSKQQAKDLFSSFKVIAIEPHYFPIRFLKFFKKGGLVHRFCDWNFGCLIYLLLEKPLLPKDSRNDKDL